MTLSVRVLKNDERPYDRPKREGGGGGKRYPGSSSFDKDLFETLYGRPFL